MPGAIADDQEREEIARVETLRLRRIELPQVGRLLDVLVARSNILPEGAYQIRDSASVPATLRPILSEATRQGKVWSCWTNGTDSWLLICQMSLTLSRRRGTPVLQVTLYNGEGALQDSGSWTTDPQGTWRRFGDGSSP